MTKAKREGYSMGEGKCIRETDAAILVRVDGEQHWIPKSNISDDSEVYKNGDEGGVVITQWLAEQKGFV